MYQKLVIVQYTYFLSFPGKKVVGIGAKGLISSLIKILNVYFQNPGHSNTGGFLRTSVSTPRLPQREDPGGMLKTSISVSGLPQQAASVPVEDNHQVLC